MKKVFVTILLAIVLSACSSIAKSPTATPTAFFPTITPFPTITSFVALTEYPEDKFLFVEAYSGEECTKGCCVEYEALPAQFLFKDGKLYIADQFPISFGNWVDTRKTNNAIGLYYFGTIIDGYFAFITSLPYSSSDSEFTINGVDRQGNISVETPYGNIFLPPEKHVENDWVEYGLESCQIRHFAGIVNYGFINDDQVVIVSHVDEFP